MSEGIFRIRRRASRGARRDDPRADAGARRSLRLLGVLPRGLAWAGVAATIALGAPLGCELILGIDDIELGPATGSGADAAPDGPADGACWEPKGFNGRGCYRSDLAECPIEGSDPIETHRRILNACTSSLCEPFDNAGRLGKLLPDGGVPDLPNTTGGGAGGEGGAGGASGAGGGAGGAGSAAGGGGGSEPLPSCSTLSGKRVYITGSNAVVPLLQRLGPILAALAPPNDLRLIYQKQSSCTGFEKIVFSEERISGEATYYEKPVDGSDTGERACLLDAEGVPADIGTCDVFGATCNTAVLPDNFIDYGSGPIQAMTFVVPKKSSAKVISREAAYFVYGFGGGSSAPPWTDALRILSRDNKSGTKRMIAEAIGVPYDRWSGAELGNTGAMKAEMKAANESSQDVADKTIGILDVINDDDAQAFLSVLAFQAKDQRCGFWPDSSPEKEDKQHVRDGHYPIWGPLHFYLRASQKAPSNPLAALVVSYVTGTKPLPNEGQDKFAYTVVKTQAQGSLIPRCAMRVDRDSELGPLRPFAPPYPCGCYFEKEVTGSTGCKECTVDTQCQASERCSYGFCEEK